MTQFLPPNLLILFAARESIPYLPPVDKLTHEKKRQPYTGVAEYLDHFEDPEETPPPVKVETRQERLERKRREKAEQNAYKIEQDLAMWNPLNYKENVTTDAYKTLFVARINYDTSESKLRREFEVYGKIKQIKMVHDSKTGKPRGYAFIEYENESDMHAAYKRADGKKIDGRRVVVDIERGRTIKGWKPRRLAGGKGGRKSHYDPISAEATSRILNDSVVDYVDDRKTSLSTKDRDRDRERDRDRGEKEKRRSRSRSRSRDKSDRKRRSKSKDRHRSRSKERSKKSRRSSRSKDRSSNVKKRSRSKERSKRDDHGSTNGNGNWNHNNNNGTEYGEEINHKKIKNEVI